jgi:integrase/recombinase XerD
MNRQCNVTKRVRTDAGIRYCPVVLSANGRITPNTVLVNGIPERHREGSYYLEWYEGTKRRRVSVGKDAADATARRLRKEAELNAKNSGVAVATESRDGRRLLSAAIADYLEDTKLSRKRKTYAAYDLTLRYFAQCCSKTYVDEIERKDLLKFAYMMLGTKHCSLNASKPPWRNIAIALKMPLKRRMKSAEL